MINKKIFDKYINPILGWIASAFICITFFYLVVHFDLILIGCVGSLFLVLLLIILDVLYSP